jgi:DNA-binding CsgD family transcriptional regulator
MSFKGKCTEDYLPKKGQPLTPSEIASLHRAANGYTNKTGGHLAGKSQQTEKNHLYKARLKLGAENTTHAVYMAVGLDLIPQYTSSEVKQLGKLFQ